MRIHKRPPQNISPIQVCVRCCNIKPCTNMDQFVSSNFLREKTMAQSLFAAMGLGMAWERVQKPSRNRIARPRTFPTPWESSPSSTVLPCWSWPRRQCRHRAHGLRPTLCLGREGRHTTCANDVCWETADLSANPPRRGDRL